MRAALAEARAALHEELDGLEVPGARSLVEGRPEVLVGRVDGVRVALELAAERVDVAVRRGRVEAQRARREGVGAEVLAADDLVARLRFRIAMAARPDVHARAYIALLGVACLGALETKALKSTAWASVTMDTVGGPNGALYVGFRGVWVDGAGARNAPSVGCAGRCRFPRRPPRNHRLPPTPAEEWPSKLARRGIR